MTGENHHTSRGTSPSLPGRRRGQVGTYYRALDRGDYDALAGILHEEFVHERPDLTLSGADRFVAFMREERPHPDPRHPINAVFLRDEDDSTGAGGETDDAGGRKGAAAGDVVAQGRLLAADGRELAAFLDVFAFEGDRIANLRTYTH